MVSKSMVSRETSLKKSGRTKMSGDSSGGTRRLWRSGSALGRLPEVKVAKSTLKVAKSTLKVAKSTLKIVLPGFPLQGHVRVNYLGKCVDNMVYPGYIMLSAQSDVL